MYAGMPIAHSLPHRGKEVHSAKLSFSAVESLPADAWLAPDVAVIGPDTVHALSHVGIRPLRAAYGALIEQYDIDAVVLVDGSTDILTRGDESIRFVFRLEASAWRCLYPDRIRDEVVRRRPPRSIPH